MNHYVISYKKDNVPVTEYVNLSEEEILKKYSSHPFKLDKILTMRKVDTDLMYRLIMQNKNTIFPYGLYIQNHYILCEELFSKFVIDYKNVCIDFVNLNKLLQSKFPDAKRVDFIENSYIFDTESKYYDGKKFIPLRFNRGFHIQDRTSLEDIKKCLKKSTNTLYRMILSSGLFIYGFDVVTGKRISNYSNIRHMGALWALCLLADYIEDKNKQTTIKKGLDSLLDSAVVYQGDKAFFLEHMNKTYYLGGNALVLLALCEYTKTFHDDSYKDLMRKFANGLLSCQQPNGGFYHEYSRDLELVNKNMCIYYDGESTFALLKYYEICKDKKYYQSVLEAFDYFIEHHYEKEYDHWIAYSIRELVKYNHEDRYLRFMNLNCSAPVSSRFGPTRLEALMALYDAYQSLIKKKVSSSVLKDYPKEDIIRNILFRKCTLMNYYIGEEMSLYFEDSDAVNYGFYAVDTTYFRMRNDDVQHTIAGLYAYCLDEIEKDL